MLVYRSVYIYIYMFERVASRTGETSSQTAKNTYHTPYPVHRIVAPCGHFKKIIEAWQALWKAIITRSQKQAAINMGACFKNNCNYQIYILK